MEAPKRRGRKSADPDPVAPASAPVRKLKLRFKRDEPAQIAEPTLEDYLRAYDKGDEGSPCTMFFSRLWKTEMTYPTRDILQIIRMAYENKTPKQISDAIPYKKNKEDNMDEIAMLIYELFILRPDMGQHPKVYKYQKEVEDRIFE
jgi:hypothetical protein